MANISRNSYVESRQYDKVILQQGSPITDYDYNEAQDIQRVKLRRIVKELFGDGALADGFKVVQATTPNQTVVVKSGTLYVQGYRVVSSTDIVVNMPTAPTSGTRVDHVYAEITEQEVDSIQDPNIKHTKLTMEPTRRSMISFTIRTGTSTPVDTDTVKYYTLAHVTRATNDNIISTAEITDKRSVKVTFEGDGFAVKGGMTLGDSATDTIDIQGTIKNTSTTNGGSVYIDDSLKVIGDGIITGKIGFDDITNYFYNDSGKIATPSSFRVDGTVYAVGGAINFGNASDTNLYRSAANLLKTDDSLEVALTFKSTGAATFLSTVGVTGATTLSSTLAVTGAATLSSTLGVTGVTTLSAAVNQSGGNVIFNTGIGDFYTMVKRNHASGSSLFVRQNGAGPIAAFGSDTTDSKLVVTNGGGITASADITTTGAVKSTGVNVQTGKYYEVARLPLFGVAGDIQYQSDTTTWEDVTNNLYYLFNLGHALCSLPSVPSGATRKYKLQIAYSVSGTNNQANLRLVTTDTTGVTLDWALPLMSGSLIDGSRWYTISNDFVQPLTANHFKLQAKTVAGEIAIYSVELIAYDVY